jgi:hypothetical protein
MSREKEAKLFSSRLKIFRAAAAPWLYSRYQQGAGCLSGGGVKMWGGAGCLKPICENEHSLVAKLHFRRAGAFRFIWNSFTERISRSPATPALTCTFGTTASLGNFPACIGYHHRTDSPRIESDHGFLSLLHRHPMFLYSCTLVRICRKYVVVSVLYFFPSLVRIFRATTEWLPRQVAVNLANTDILLHRWCSISTYRCHILLPNLPYFTYTMFRMLMPNSTDEGIWTSVEGAITWLVTCVMYRHVFL